MCLTSCRHRGRGFELGSKYLPRDRMARMEELWKLEASTDISVGKNSIGN